MRQRACILEEPLSKATDATETLDRARRSPWVRLSSPAVYFQLFDRFVQPHASARRYATLEVSRWARSVCNGQDPVQQAPRPKPPAQSRPPALPSSKAFGEKMASVSVPTPASTTPRWYLAHPAGPPINQRYTLGQLVVSGHTKWVCAEDNKNRFMLPCAKPVPATVASLA